MSIKQEFEKAFDDHYENIPEGETRATPSMDIALWAAKWMAEMILQEEVLNHDTIRKFQKELS